jgi:MFS family permease
MQAGWILVMACAILGVASSPNVASAAAFGFVGGAAEMAHTASNMASMQMAAPPEMRGRVASLTMLYPAMISAGAFLAGPLSDALSVRGASALLAAISITATAALYVFSPHLREMRTQ